MESITRAINHTPLKKNNKYKRTDEIFSTLSMEHISGQIDKMLSKIIECLGISHNDPVFSKIEHTINTHAQNVIFGLSLKDNDEFLKTGNKSYSDILRLYGKINLISKDNGLKIILKNKIKNDLSKTDDAMEKMLNIVNETLALH